MKVRDVALKEMHCAKPDSNLSAIASMMKRHNVGFIPVCDGDRLIGMITDRDIVIGCIAADMDVEACPVREFMTSNPVTVSPDTDLEEAARIMGKEQVRRLPVLEDGKLVGLLSLGDLAAALLGKDNVLAETLRRISTPTQTVLPC